MACSLLRLFPSSNLPACSPKVSAHLAFTTSCGSNQLGVIGIELDVHHQSGEKECNKTGRECARHPHRGAWKNLSGGACNAGTRLRMIQVCRSERMS